jgi:hypothetical protein
MKKILFLFAVSIFFFSACGPNAEEVKKMKEDVAKTFDSMKVEADKKIKEDLRIQDSVSNSYKVIDSLAKRPQ